MGEAAVSQTAGVEQAATCAWGLWGYKCALVRLFNHGCIQVFDIHLNYFILKQLLIMGTKNTAHLFILMTKHEFYN